MRMLMPRYRRWAILAEAAFLFLLIVGAAVGEFSDHHRGLAWFALAMAAVVLIAGWSKWRRGA